MKVVRMVQANDGKNKYMVYIRDDNDKIHTVKFGAKGYSNFTKHKNPMRKQRYITRHQKRENWGKSGAFTPGFWSRWVLWNKPTIQASLRVAKLKIK